ncbi:hypothetical protein EB118_23125 [bacterium]|nr:hypothetical protein [bacterium]NDG32948.1 hypothetical protein [bacterium]
MRSKVVNFMGAPGVGKSTVTALTFAEIKCMHKSVELVQEYAKQLVWQSRFDELNNQWFVSNSQYKMLKAVDSKVEWICTDSPLLLGLFYNRYHKDNVCNVEKTERMIMSRINEFDNVYIFLERGDFPYETQGRIHTIDESDEIQNQLKDLLDTIGVSYLTVKSDKSSIPDIIKYLGV